MVIPRFLVTSKLSGDWSPHWVLAVMVAFALSAAAQSFKSQFITVRFLDYKSAQPIAKLNVMIEAYNGEWSRGRTADRTIIFSMSTKTSKDGTLVVNLPLPIPQHLRVSSSDIFQNVRDFCPDDVLKSGVVVLYQKHKPRSPIVAKPGEIVIVNRRIGPLDRMRQELP